MLELTNIKKQYHSNTIIDIPHLKLEPGIYWLRGANGSGKTTLLKMIAALLPFEGDIILNNIHLKNNPLLYRQQVSWAEAEPLYPAFMTGKDLIALYTKVRKSAWGEVNNLVEIFGMAAYINEAIGTYSAGMTKKLSLVLALIGNPLLVVLDEPLITLDATTIQTVSDIILEKRKTLGSNFLMSSHQDLQEQIAIADKRLTIYNRTIVADEPSI